MKNLLVRVSILILHVCASTAMEIVPDVRTMIVWELINQSPDLPSMSHTICALRITNKEFCHVMHNLIGTADSNGSVDIKKNITFVQNYLRMRFPVIRSEIFAQKLPLKRYANYHRFDFSITRHYPKRWGMIDFNLSIYNVYSRINPFYYRIGVDNQGNKQIIRVGLFPIIPSLSMNFKF